MSEPTRVLWGAGKKKNSFKSTIPKGIVKEFHLSAGDILFWDSITTSQGNKYIQVSFAQENHFAFLFRILHEKSCMIR